VFLFNGARSELQQYSNRRRLLLETGGAIAKIGSHLLGASANEFCRGESIKEAVEDAAA
jgi:hypothetical protein